MKIIILLLSPLIAQAELVKFQWDTVTSNNPKNAIIRTHLYTVKLPNYGPVFLAESFTNTVEVEMLPGQYNIVASSENLQGWSVNYSDPISVVVEYPPIVPPPITPIKKRFFIQKTIDLIKWEDVSELLDDEPIQFYRIKIVTP